MPEQRQPQREEEEQPRMNFMTMFMLFFLIRNLMGGFGGAKPQETPGSIIDRYNRSLSTNEPERAPEPDNPISGMFSMMKGMMPVNKGEKGAIYHPVLQDGDLCVQHSFLL